MISPWRCVSLDEPTLHTKIHSSCDSVLLLFHLADTLSLYQHRIPTLYVTVLRVPLFITSRLRCLSSTDTDLLLNLFPYVPLFPRSLNLRMPPCH